MRRRFRVLALLAAAAAPAETPRPVPVETTVETLFEQVHPETDGRTNDRAVVLIHGLRLHPFSAPNTRAAYLHDWQKPGAMIVTELGAHADVYSFAYGQNVSIPTVAESEGLAKAIASLSEAGYTEIVLVGHSSGAVISREFVEEHPDAGVTKIVQVSPPNGGSHWVNFAPDFHGTQTAFLSSIRVDDRFARPAERKVPANVEMVVVMGDGLAWGDFLVRDEYQWPPDLQEQGIPVVQMRTLHFTAMRSRRIVREMVKLVTEPQPRWTPEQVEEARREMIENAFERAWEGRQHASDEWPVPGAP